MVIDRYRFDVQVSILFFHGTETGTRLREYRRCFTKISIVRSLINGISNNLDEERRSVIRDRSTRIQEVAEFWKSTNFW
jgi:hypothetical protein